MRNNRFLIVGVIAILIPVGIELFILRKNFPSVVKNSEWLGFFGSYLGGIATLIGVHITIKTQEERENTRRKLDIKPYLDVVVSRCEGDEHSGERDVVFEINGSGKDRVRFEIFDFDRLDMKRVVENDSYDHMYLKYKIRNLGAASAVNMTAKVNNRKYNTAVAENETVVFYLFIKNELENQIVNIELDYWDKEGRGHYIKKDSVLLNLDGSFKPNPSEASEQPL